VDGGLGTSSVSLLLQEWSLTLNIVSHGQTFHSAKGQENIPPDSEKSSGNETTLNTGMKVPAIGLG